VGLPSPAVLDPSSAAGGGSQILVALAGMNYIAYAFVVDFLRSPLHRGVKQLIQLQYLPFAVLAVAGPALSLTASVWRLEAKVKGSTQ
jgi:hypothetical protein